MSKRRKKKNNKKVTIIAKGMEQNNMIITKDSKQSKKMSRIFTKVKPIVKSEKLHNLKKTPLHVSMAMDVYANQLSYKEVADKYKRSKDQVYWLFSKSVKSNFKSLWDIWHNAKKQKKEFNVPFYMKVAAEVVINNKSFEDIATEYNKSLRSVKQVVSTSIKNKLPYIWQLMANNGIVSVKKG